MMMRNVFSKFDVELGYEGYKVSMSENYYSHIVDTYLYLHALMETLTACGLSIMDFFKVTLHFQHFPQNG